VVRVAGGRRAAATACGLALAWAVLAGACGGDDGGGGGGSDGPDGPRELRVRPSDEPPGAIDALDTTCSFDGDRQVLGSGIVRNAGDKAYHVSITVRFLDADGVRIDLASDSVSDLQQGERARWSASVYVDDPDAVVECVVDTSFS
jgi:hypothetical protein